LQEKLRMGFSFDYNLPQERIALYPLQERSDSKLLMYDGQVISTKVFSDLPQILSEFSLMVRNSSKVLRSRIFMNRISGAKIEFFFLEAENILKGTATVHCLIRNVKKLKKGEVLSSSVTVNNEKIVLYASYVEKTADHCRVKFNWSDDSLDFYEILYLFGITPLPPYINRNVTESDTERYQTIYAHEHGSVAAPTAGLHFSEKLGREFKMRNIETVHVVLHVGLGTFQPMKSDHPEDHTMHSEHFSVSKQTIEQLADFDQHNIVCVGTTTLRTLESLYIAGHTLSKEASPYQLCIGQWDAQRVNSFMPRQNIWNSLIEYMNSHGVSYLSGKTSLMITPEYSCRSIDYLITNFHQPNSTLLLIVASLIGNKWKEVYQYALDNEFRFLSYGDACLFKNLRTSV